MGSTEVSYPQPPLGPFGPLGLTLRSLVDINLLQLLHRSLLVSNNDVRTVVLDTLYVLTTRSVIPLQDNALIRMRRDAFSEDALQGYSQVLDQIFAGMITNTNGQLDIDRETYGVGKKFVMVHANPFIIHSPYSPLWLLY